MLAKLIAISLRFSYWTLMILNFFQPRSRWCYWRQQALTGNCRWWRNNRLGTVNFNGTIGTEATIKKTKEPTML